MLELNYFKVQALLILVFNWAHRLYSLHRKALPNKWSMRANAKTSVGERGIKPGSTGLWSSGTVEL